MSKAVRPAEGTPGNGFSFRPHRLFLNYLFSIKNLTLEFCALSIHKLQRGKYPLLKSICFYLKIGVKKDAQYCGGMNLFGSGFGDYPQAIVMKIYGKAEPPEKHKK